MIFLFNKLRKICKTQLKSLGLTDNLKWEKSIHWDLTPIYRGIWFRCNHHSNPSRENSAEQTSTLWVQLLQVPGVVEIQNKYFWYSCTLQYLPPSTETKMLLWEALHEIGCYESFSLSQNEYSERKSELTCTVFVRISLKILPIFKDTENT
jgi:hypothetical protein